MSTQPPKKTQQKPTGASSSNFLRKALRVFAVPPSLASHFGVVGDCRWQSQPASSLRIPATQQPFSPTQNNLKRGTSYSKEKTRILPDKVSFVGGFTEQPKRTGNWHVVQGGPSRISPQAGSADRCLAFTFCLGVLAGGLAAMETQKNSELSPLWCFDLEPHPAVAFFC